MKHIWIATAAVLLLATGCKSKIEQVENVDSYGYTERYQRSKEASTKNLMNKAA
jgi:hypothetical protein